MLWNDKRIPNMVAEFKSNNIWPFLGKEYSKTGKIPDLVIFDNFMAKKGFNCYSILILSPDLESSHHSTIF